MVLSMIFDIHTIPYSDIIVGMEKIFGVCLRDFGKPCSCADALTKGYPLLSPLRAFVCNDKCSPHGKTHPMVGKKSTSHRNRTHWDILMPQSTIITSQMMSP